MKKKINIIKLFSLVLTFLIICITGFNLKVNAGYSGDDGYYEEINKLISLEGATVTVPSGWTCDSNFFVSHRIRLIYNDYTYTSIYLGYYRVDRTDQVNRSNSILFYDYNDNTDVYTYVNIDNSQSFSFIWNGGDIAINTTFIQWLFDNDAIIEGGLYADDVVSVTNDIGDSKLVWELKWTETTEENVNDYVAIYPSSDTKQCYISFKKSFSIPMELLVKIEGDENVYASCDVDCYERTETITDTSLSVSIDGSTNFDLLLGQDVEENEITFNGNTTFESIFENQKVELNSMTCVPVTKGTLGTTQEISYKIGLSEELQTLLEAREITFISTTSSLITTSVKGLLESLITFNADNKEIIYEALNTTENWFRIDVEVVDKYHDETINEYLYKIDIIGFMIDDYYFTSIIPTDLTGYTVTVPHGWTVTSGYGRFSLIGSVSWNGESSINMQGFGVGVNKSWFDSSTNCAITTNFSSPDNTNTTSKGNSNYILFSITGGTDVTNPRLIEWFVDNGATFTKSEEDVVLKTFQMIEANSMITVIETYTYEEGMTWEEFVNSDYNTNDMFLIDDSSGNVKYIYGEDAGGVLYKTEGDPVDLPVYSRGANSSDVIHFAKYYAWYMGTGGSN